MKLFNLRSEKVAYEGQAIRAQRSVEDQALKASVSEQIRSVQLELESKSPSLVQFKTNVLVSSNRQSSQCTLAIGRSCINIDNSLKDRIYYLLQKRILYKEILEEMKSTEKNELIQRQENMNFRKKYR